MPFSMARSQSLAAAAALAASAAIVLSSNPLLYPHLIISASSGNALPFPCSVVILSHQRTYPAGLLYRRKCGRLAARVRELQASLAAATEKASAERRGRVRAQQVGTAVH